MTGHGLTAGFFDDGRRLRLTLDIAKGWRRTKRSWRFGARQVVDLLGGWTLSCTVTVVDDGQYGPQFEQELDPEFEFWTNEAEASAIPSFPQSDDTEGEIAFRQDGTQATFEIPVFSEAPGRKLTRSLPWRYVDGRFEFSDYRGGRYEHYRTMPGNRIRRPYCFRLKGVVREPPREAVGPTWEHDLPLPSAGLPSLGTRR